MIGPKGCTIDGLAKKIKAKKTKTGGTKRKRSVAAEAPKKRRSARLNPVLAVIGGGTKRPNPFDTNIGGKRVRTA